jgi:lysophospholipase L1-like esterase
MHRLPRLPRAAALALAGSAALLAPVGLHAQTYAPQVRPAALPASPSAARLPSCVIAANQVRLDIALPRTARRVVSGKRIKVVALGSSSTYGAGASTSAASYPSRLAQELTRHFPGREIVMVNRGVNGEEVADMLARLGTAVIAEQPDLVLWQVGTNSVLRDKALPPHASLLHEGLVRLKAVDADVVLIDPQYAPKVIAKPNARRMVKLIAQIAKDEHVALFHRFELMRHWHESQRLSFETFLSEDGLHMNDWSYGCLAKGLGIAIADAATRSEVRDRTSDVRGQRSDVRD